MIRVNTHWYSMYIKSNVVQRLHKSSTAKSGTYNVLPTFFPFLVNQDLVGVLIALHLIWSYSFKASLLVHNAQADGISYVSNPHNREKDRDKVLRNEVSIAER